MEQIQAVSIFNRATGYIARGGFGWTCNPYVGCTFSCKYCYAAFLPQNNRPREEWGQWLRAKVNAVDRARKQAHKLAGAAVYVSTVTDPYVPVERSLMLTRGILETLVPYQPRLVVQTRSPLVVRDIGSNIFPETEFKFYLDASLDERSKRRAADGVKEDLAARDQRDSQRAAAPLMVPLGAKVINNSHLTSDQTSGLIIEEVRKRLRQ